MDEKSLKENNRLNNFYIQLVGELDDGNIRKAIEEIDIANAKEYVDQIIMTLVTYGGDIFYSFALYDHIKSSKKPIDIIAEGMCMSAGVMVLQAARKRIARPHTIFLVYPTLTLTEGKSYPEFISVVDQYKKNYELFVQLSIERSGMSRADFERIYTPRKYLTPQEALKFGEHGLIDDIKER